MARGRKGARLALLLLFVAACASDGTDSGVAVSAEAAIQTETTESPGTDVASTVPIESTSTTTVSETTSTTLPPSDTTTSTAVPPTTTDAPPATTSTSNTTTSTAVPPTTTTSTTTTTLPDDLTVVEVVYREGKVVSESRVDVPLGNRISLVFDTDARLLVHIHGYDEEFSVEAGVSTTYEMVGDLPGIFEVEDHVTHRHLLELKVSP